VEYVNGNETDLQKKLSSRLKLFGLLIQTALGNSGGCGILPLNRLGLF